MFSGRLDEETIKTMNLPRCGVSDLEPENEKSLLIGGYYKGGPHPYAPYKRKNRRRKRTNSSPSKSSHVCYDLK